MSSRPREFGNAPHGTTAEIDVLTRRRPLAAIFFYGASTVAWIAAAVIGFGPGPSAFTTSAMTTCSAGQ